jgi:hypothetical protein
MRLGFRGPRARALVLTSGALVLSAFAAGALAVGCGSSDDTKSTGSTGSGGGGGGAAVTFQPEGCGFSIAGRPEYEEFSPGKSETAAEPNIRRVRLGLGGNVAVGAAGRADPATSAGFAWQTDEGTLASEVAWGPTPDAATWPAENRASGVTWRTPPGDINPNGSARMHEAYVCGLEPATTYYYRVGGGPAGKEVWSDVYSFTTTPKDPKTEVTIAVSGDSRGQQNDAWRLLQRQVHKLSPTVQLFNGDAIVFAQDQREWEQWLDRASADTDGTALTLAQTLTLTAHGNHDNHTALYFGNVVLPQDVATYPKYGELFYSVDVGPVHVVVLDDAWIVSPSGDTDYAKVLGDWLEADLGAAEKNRANVPWILVTHHHGEFSSSTHGTDPDVLRGRKWFVPIFDAHHVDLAILSHDHNYERSKPLTGPADKPTIQASTKDGTVYVICAGAGADGYHKGTSDFTETSHDYVDGPAVGLYGVIKASQAKLEFEAHDLVPDGSDPVFDSFTLTK